MLGIVAQSLAEITVLAEKGGVARSDFLAFLNDSVMGSMFTRYKTPAIVNLDYTPTFTPALLLKDFHLGFEAARDLGVPMPVAATAEQIIQSLVGNGYDDVDFQVMLEVRGAGRRAPAGARGRPRRRRPQPARHRQRQHADRGRHAVPPAVAQRRR